MERANERPNVFRRNFEAKKFQKAIAIKDLKIMNMIIQPRDINTPVSSQNTLHNFKFDVKILIVFNKIIS